jgi:hypothetical protein
MSFHAIVTKLLDSMKQEITKEENLQMITDDILQPIVQRVIDHMYPYLIGISVVFTLIIVLIIAILCLNVKICLK